MSTLLYLSLVPRSPTGRTLVSAGFACPRLPEPAGPIAAEPEASTSGDQGTSGATERGRSGVEVKGPIPTKKIFETNMPTTTFRWGLQIAVSRLLA